MWANQVRLEKRAQQQAPLGTPNRPSEEDG